MTPISEKARRKISELNVEATRKRYELAATRIDETLGPGGVGLIIIGEYHQIQIPQDI